MAGCCSTGSTKQMPPGKHKCPVDGEVYSEVSAQTIIHHLSKPWNWDDQGESFYFCDAPDCDVIYFSATGRIITQDQLRTAVGQKDCSESATLCYCFGVTRGAYLKDQRIKAYVVDQTRKQTCACDSRNPSGRCCLKDFPRDDV